MQSSAPAINLWMKLLLLLSRSVDLISNLKTGLCLVALAAGRPVGSSDYPPYALSPPSPQRYRLPRRCLYVTFSQPVRGYFPVAPWPVTTAWPRSSYGSHICEAEGNQWINWHGAEAEKNDHCANSYSSLYWAVIRGKLNWWRKEPRFDRDRGHEILIDGLNKPGN